MINYQFYFDILDYQMSFRDYNGTYLEYLPYHLIEDIYQMVHMMNLKDVHDNYSKVVISCNDDHIFFAYQYPDCIGVLNKCVNVNDSDTYHIYGSRSITNFETTTYFTKIPEPKYYWYSSGLNDKSGYKYMMSWREKIMAQIALETGNQSKSNK